MPGWMRHRLESRLPEEIIISNMHNMLTSKEGENALGSHFETKANIPAESTGILLQNNPLGTESL